MNFDFRELPRRLFGPDFTLPGYLCARWLFLRALGLVFFSAFYSLVFQIRGLIGPNGILPARDYLAQVARVVGSARYWYAPTGAAEPGDLIHVIHCLDLQGRIHQKLPELRFFELAPAVYTERKPVFSHGYGVKCRPWTLMTSHLQTAP